LGLHAHRWKCRFTYVGGQQRTKDGVGIVVYGNEEVMQNVNPWDALGFQAVADYAKLFDEGAFASAYRAVDQVMRNVSEPSRKRELGTLKNLAEAYQAWNQFNHKEADKKLGDARRAGNDLSAALCDPVAAKRLLTTLECHSNLLKEIRGGSRMAVVKDLLANARRRMAEMRWDDATARLYRAIEATAQARLHDAHQIADTKHLELERLPKALREEWQGRARNGVMMVGLQDAYALLHQLHDLLGSKFYSLELAGNRSPLTARNDSILAHGFKRITKKACTALWQCALALVDCEERDLCQFPLLRGIAQECADSADPADPSR
jgi:CRISPR-associated protein (TIGR02710 family)